MTSKKPSHYYKQSGVIPYKVENSEVKILLITSRKGKKWKIPKGIIETTLTPKESAAKEAFEEAGIIGVTGDKELGSYTYKKWGGKIEVALFPMAVKEELETWEESFRIRRWTTVDEARNLVEEPSLKKAIVNLAANVSEIGK